MKKALRILCLLLTLGMLFVTVACDSGKKPSDDVTEPTDDATTTEEPSETIDPTQPHDLKLTWHHGIIGSSSHKTSALKILDGEKNYSYTDIFCIEKAGTTIQFVDDDAYAGDNKGKAGYDTLVLSTWVEKDGNWVIDRFGPSYASSSTAKSAIVKYGENGSIIYTYTTTSDNEYLRICYHSGETEDFKPTQHMKVTAQYTGEPGTAIEFLKEIAWMKDSPYESILEGLEVTALGDSYLAPNYEPWLNLLAEKYLVKVNNYAIGGSTVSTAKSATDTSSRNPMVERYQRMAKSDDPDIVIIEGGRNDHSMGATIGAVDSTNPKEFSGALNIIIDGLQEKYPNAMFVCIGPWNFPDNGNNSLSYKAFADGMAAVAKAQGIYFIDSSNVEVMGVDMRNAAFRIKYCKNENDVSHLNAAGMKLVFPKFESYLADFYEDFLSKKAN